MTARRIVVLGAGVSGLAAALLLARDGHQVTVVERDELDTGSAQDSPSWSRRGIPHFLQPHAFIPRGRLEMMRHLPDVHAALIEAGADTVDLCRKLPGGVRQPGDEDLQYLGVRRPLIEWALRRGAAAEDGVELRPHVRARGLVVDGGRVSAVAVDGGDIEADVVIDAMGRRTPTIGWLADAGIDAPEPAASDCGVVYYSRYYQRQVGLDPPDGPWPLSPRGDLGYLGFSTFPGDNRTYAVLLAVPNGSTDWRHLKDAQIFESALATIPALRGWVGPDAAVPITDVLPMAGLRNSLRAARGAVAAGVVPVGDALGHTDPVLAHGLAFGLVHARELTAALRSHDDDRDAGAAYLDAVMPWMEERFALATALDEQRHRMWTGGHVDPAHRDGDYALFTMTAAAAAASADPAIFRVFMRRLTLLDSTSVLDDNLVMQQLIEDTFARMSAQPRPAPGPEREEMLSLVSAHG